jgi:hypothetical protein
MIRKRLLLLLALGAQIGRAQTLPSTPATTLAPSDLKIVYFGSSVPFGQGATGKYGYTGRYSALLTQRAAAGLGAPWTTANISIPGDNTLKVLERWERDLPPQQGRYVVYASATRASTAVAGPSSTSSRPTCRCSFRKPGRRDWYQ